jgi:YVTN family beta-propeller protein
MKILPLCLAPAGDGGCSSRLWYLHTMNAKIRLLSLIICVQLARLKGETTPQTALLVLSKADQTLAIVDPATRKVVARMPSGPDPHEVVASTDGKLAFISNYGGGAYNTITVVDLIAQKTLAPVDLGPLRGPHGLTFVGGKVWFTAEAAKVIGSYDPFAKKIDWVLGTGQNRTHMIFVFDDLKRVITSNVSSATMTIIDKSVRSGPGPGGPGPGGPPPGGPPPGGPPPGMANGPRKGGPGGPPGGDWDETVISVGRGAEGFDLSPDRKEIWAANAQDGTISIVNLEMKKVIQTLEADVRSANRLKFTPDGKLVFVSTLSGPDLVILDAATRKEVKRIKIGHGAAGIQMEPGGLRAYVACTPDDYVTVIDLKSLQLIDKIDAGKQPDGMAWVVGHP